MSTISTGIGLVSGLNIQSIVDSLIAVQSRPIDLIKTRVAGITQQRTALLSLSAQLLAIRSAAARFKTDSAFSTAIATSSNDQVLQATTGSSAAAGQYSFLVRNLASNSQVISTGFATSDSTALGSGTLTIETSAALVNRSTLLRNLNGGAGVPAGKIRITDRAGASTEVDLAGAASIRDVIHAINSQTSVDVTASVKGDKLVLTDTSGGTGLLRVQEVGNGHTAAGLGLLGSVSADVFEGQNLVRLSNSTALADVNDGAGVRRANGGGDFTINLSDGSTLAVSLSEQINDNTRLAALNNGGGVPAGSIRITNRAGATADIDLSTATTLGDVKAAITAANLNVAMNYNGGKLVLTDSSTGTGSFKIEELAGGTTAGALGIDNPSANSVITGDVVYRVQTLGDVLRVINTDVNNNGRVNAALSADGWGLTLTDNTGGAGALSVTAIGTSSAAIDLGLDGPAVGSTLSTRRLIGGLDSVLLRTLNGGAGVERGVLSLRDRAGNTAQVDVTGAQSLSDVLDAINAAGLGITASVSSNGLGIQLQDTSGGTGNLQISDVTGHTARDLGIDVDSASSIVRGNNLQRQYVSGATRLTAFREGAGVPPGKFRITDSTGASAIVDLTQGNEVTLQDVIDEINSRPIGVEASINATGDGILLTDTAGGVSRMKVTEEGGTTAKALNLLGEAAAGTTVINGSLETRITVTAGDTLQSLVTKIRATGAPVTASIVNDSSAANSFRLNLSSTVSGRVGELAIDGGTTALSFETLVAARDASVIFGSGDSSSPIVLTSSTNTFTNAVDGLNLTLVGTSAQPVTVTVNRSIDGLIKDIGQFVTAYNTALSTIKQATSFNVETSQRGILLGDDAANRVRDRLNRIANRVIPGVAGPYNRLGAVGISVVTNGGGTLALDEAKFRAAYEADPAAVTRLFTDETNGFGKFIGDEIDALTQNETGVITRRNDSLQETADLLNRRAEALQVLVEKQRQRLTAQFNNTESILARLQAQQNSLAALTSITG